jgi:hypothetical protein
MRRLTELLRRPGVHLGLFLTGAALLSWPLVSLTEGEGGLAMVAYLGGVWVALLAALGAVAWALGREPPD